MAFEDPQIVTRELTKEFKLDQILNAFDPLQPTDNATAAAAQYSQIAQKWREGVTTFAARMNRASAAAWEGPAAEKSRTAITNYTQRATDLTPELDALANRVAETAQAITLTKQNLPENVESFSWTSPSTWFGWKDDDREEAEEKAREVMDTNYLNPFVATDQAVPRLSTPVSPTNPLYGDTDEGTGGGNDTDNGGSDGTSDGAGDDQGTATDPAATTETPTEEQDPTTEDESTDDTTDDDESSDDDSDDDTTPTSATPTDTTPAATTPTTGSPSTGAPGGGTGGGGTGGGGGGSGAPGTGLLSPNPGRSVAGAPSTGTPASAAAAAAANRGGTGRAGMPGMMGAPGAGRGKGEGDDEHKIPDYLITAENTDELLGEQPRTIAGGVIGGDAPAATTPPQQH